MSQDSIDRLFDRFDKIEDKLELIQKDMAGITRGDKDHEKRISKLENRFWWLVGLWLTGTLGVLFYILRGVLLNGL